MVDTEKQKTFDQQARIRSWQEAHPGQKATKSVRRQLMREAQQGQSRPTK